MTRKLEFNKYGIVSDKAQNVRLVEFIISQHFANKHPKTSCCTFQILFLQAISQLGSGWLQNLLLQGWYAEGCISWDLRPFLADLGPTESWPPQPGRRNMKIWHENSEAGRLSQLTIVQVRISIPERNRLLHLLTLAADRICTKLVWDLWTFFPFAAMNAPLLDLESSFSSWIKFSAWLGLPAWQDHRTSQLLVKH